MCRPAAGVIRRDGVLSPTKLIAAHPCRYGPVLRERDPQAFEQMRLVVGYYDLPQVRGGRDKGADRGTWCPPRNVWQERRQLPSACVGLLSSHAAALLLSCTHTEPAQGAPGTTQHHHHQQHAGEHQSLAAPHAVMWRTSHAGLDLLLTRCVRGWLLLLLLPHTDVAVHT